MVEKLSDRELLKRIGYNSKNVDTMTDKQCEELLKWIYSEDNDYEQ